MADKSFANFSYRRNEILPNGPRELKKRMEGNDMETTYERGSCLICVLFVKGLIGIKIKSRICVLALHEWKRW